MLQTKGVVMRRGQYLYKGDKSSLPMKELLEATITFCSLIVSEKNHAPYFAYYSKRRTPLTTAGRQKGYTLPVRGNEK